jgi:hypothetical protein
VVMRMPRDYVASNGQHKRGRKPGGIKQPKKAEPCNCGDKAMRMYGDYCARCGRLLPDYET